MILLGISVFVFAFAFGFFYANFPMSISSLEFTSSEAGRDFYDYMALLLLCDKWTDEIYYNLSDAKSAKININEMYDQCVATGGKTMMDWYDN